MKVKNIVSAQRHALRKILEPSLRRYARAEGGDGRVFRVSVAVHIGVFSAIFTEPVRR